MHLWPIDLHVPGQPGRFSDFAIGPRESGRGGQSGERGSGLARMECGRCIYAKQNCDKGLASCTHFLQRGATNSGVYGIHTHS